MDRLFLTPDDRQQEIERLCEGKFPFFGYAVLRLVALEGGHFNVVITTNFDDLTPDALYLFTQARPLVIGRRLRLPYSYVQPTPASLWSSCTVMPILLHSTQLRRRQACRTASTAKVSTLIDRGLIVIGYGGNDVGNQGYAVRVAC